MSSEVVTVSNFVGGEWVGAASGRTYQRENPAHLDEVVSVLRDRDPADVEQAVEHVANGYHAWAETPPETRADVLLRAADLLAQRADALAVELVREEGETLGEARVETRRTPQNLRMYAGESLRLNGESIQAPGSGLVVTMREPVRVGAAITCG